MKVQIAVCALLLGAAVSAQADPISPKDAEAVLAGAHRITKSVMEGDPGVSIELMNPKILKDIGGKEKARQMALKSSNNMKQQGTVVSEYEAFKPTEIFHATNEDVAFVKTRMVVDNVAARVTTESILIASRPKKDSHWYYSSGGFLSHSREPLAELFPGLDKTVPVPELKPQVVVNKQENGQGQKDPHGQMPPHGQK